MWESLEIRRPWEPESVGSNPTVLTALMLFQERCVILRRKYARKEFGYDQYVLYDLLAFFRSSSKVERLAVNQTIEVQVLAPEL